MKPHELKSAIQRDGLVPLYLVVGEEAYLRDRAVAIIRAAANTQSCAISEESDHEQSSSENAEQFFNYDVLYGDETDALEVKTIAQEMSFFSARRLVIMAWAEKLPTREGEALISYFQSPTDSTTLVMMAAKLDGRLKWVQQLKKHAVFVDCAPLYENQRIGWVTQQATQAGVKLEENALQMLKELAADGLYITHSEIEKLSAYLPVGTCGTLQDVETIRGMEPGASVFDLSEAIGARERGRALQIIAKNLDVGGSSVTDFGSIDLASSPYMESQRPTATRVWLSHRLPSK